MLRIIAIGLSTGLFLSFCGNPNKPDKEITVFCAASLTNVIQEIKSDWEKEHDQKIVLNFASSGTLARQIEYGAKADIFLSANREWLEYIQKVNGIKSNSKPIAKNRLVVITGTNSGADSASFQQMLQSISTANQKIAIGDPGHVPLGKYTKNALEKLRIYQSLSSVFILAKDARNTLRLVELGEADYGIVYGTDAISSSNVKIIAEVPEENYDPISYEAILINQDKSSAGLFFENLASAESCKAWAKHGFIF